MTRIASLLLAALVATPAAAAVVYDFRQINRSDALNAQPIEVSGKGMIDGARSRVEFTSGNAYPPGTVILSERGAREVTLMNAEKKTYATIDIAAVANRLGSANLEVDNFKSRVVELPGQVIVSGLPTEHYRIETSYDITWTPGTLKLTQRVETVVEKWTTSAFGDVAGSFVDETPFRTGNPKLDAIIGAEMSKVKGLPLRQVVTTTTTVLGDISGSKQLAPRPSRTQSSEIILSNVRFEVVPEAMFSIPPGFNAAGEASDEKGPTMHILSMEPSAP